jgi:hypothetical protein
MSHVQAQALGNRAQFTRLGSCLSQGDGLLTASATFLSQQHPFIAEMGLGLSRRQPSLLPSRASFGACHGVISLNPS